MDKSFLLNPISTAYTRSVANFAAQILAANFDYVCALMITVHYIKSIFFQSDEKEHLISILGEGQANDEEIVRQIKYYYKKTHKQVESDEQSKQSKKIVKINPLFFKHALRRLRNLLSKNMDLTAIDSPSFDFQALLDKVSSYAQVENLVKIINVPKLRADTIFTSLPPTFFNMKITPRSNSHIREGARQRIMEICFQISRDKNIDESIQKAGTLKLRRTFTLRESKPHYAEHQYISDIVNLMFTMETDKTYEIWNLDSPKERPNQYLPLFSESFLSYITKGEMPSEPKLKILFEDFLPSIIPLKGDAELIAFLKEILNKMKTLMGTSKNKGYLPIKEFISYVDSSFFEHYSPILKKANQFGKKIHFSSSSSRSFFPNINNLYTVLTEQEHSLRDMLTAPEQSKLPLLQKVSTFFHLFFIFSKEYFLEETIRPALLSVTPSGQLEVISRWRVAKHQHQTLRNKKRYNPFSLGIDMGISELATFDVRRTDSSEYIFSDSHGEELTSAALSVKDLSDELQDTLMALKKEYYSPQGVREILRLKMQKIDHLWGVHQKTYARYAQLLSKPSLTPSECSLIRKVYLESEALTSKIRNSTRDIAHHLTGFLRRLCALLNVESLHIEQLRGFEPIRTGSKTLNKELSGWIRRIFAELLEYKAEAIKYAPHFAALPPAYTSKLCHRCGAEGLRGSYTRRQFIEKGYGLAFKCINPFCQNHEKIINADLNAARNIAL